MIETIVRSLGIRPALWSAAHRYDRHRHRRDGRSGRARSSADRAQAPREPDRQQFRRYRNIAHRATHTMDRARYRPFATPRKPARD